MSRTLLSLAGFQVIISGRFWVIAEAHWHRGRNDGTTLVRFLSVFIGAKDVPTILHLPSGKIVGASTADTDAARKAPAA